MVAAATSPVICVRPPAATPTAVRRVRAGYGKAL